MSAASFYAAPFEVRADLDDAHRRAWEHVSRCGTWWSAAQRRAAAATVIVAFNDPAPPPPWVPYTSDEARRRAIAEVNGAPLDDTEIARAVLDIVARMTAHASSLTSSWFTAITASNSPTSLMNDQAYVELCGIVMSVAAVCSFARTIGASLPPLPPLADADEPSRVRVAADRSPRNWVPVSPPGGTSASVIEALSIAPSAYELLWFYLAPAQYMTNDQMDDLAFTRGNVSRPQAELLAGRVAALRQCFF